MDLQDSPESKAMARARKLGLSAQKVSAYEYRVTCVAGGCKIAHTLPFHTVTIGTVFDRCDCEYQTHVMAGICKHIGAAMLHVDFERPALPEYRGDPFEGLTGGSPLMEWR